MSDDIKKPRQEYSDQLPSLELNRLAIGGARPVKASGVKCLEPLASMKATTCYDEQGMSTTTYGEQLTAKGRSDYNKYLDNATFIGFTGQTVTGLKGLIKSKPAVHDIPTALEFILEDADGAGTSLDNLADLCTSEAFPSIRQALLITAPETDGTNSRLDDENNNIRPKMAHYTQESIINWHYEVVKNKLQLTMVVLKESKSVRDGFEVKVESQYRHLALIEGIYQQELRNKDNEIVEPMSPVLMNGKTINRIPLRVAITGSNNKSVIDDMVDANMLHYKVRADHGNLLHQSAFPVFYETGVVNGESANGSIGPGVKWEGGSEASFGVIQIDANKCSHPKELKDIESNLSNLGADMLKESKAAESGEAKRLDKVSSNSTTIDLANCVSDMISETLQDISDIWGTGEEVSYRLNTDYDPSHLDYQMIAAIGDIWERGLIDKEEAQYNLKQGEVIRADRDIEEMNKNIDSEEGGLGLGDE